MTSTSTATMDRGHPVEAADAEARSSDRAIGPLTVGAPAATRVLHVLFEPVVGGCESLCIDLVTAFAEKGHAHDVVFLSARPGPAVDRLRAVRGARLYVCELGRSRIAFGLRFAALCRERSFASVVINYAIGAQFLVAAGARLGGVGQVFSCFGNPPPADPRLRRATRRQARLARPFVTAEVACSRYVADGLEQAYGLPAGRVRVVHNWCDAGGIARRADSVRRASAPGQPSTGPVLGMIARLDRIKDHDTVLRAFAAFASRRTSARLRLIGSGPLRADLERRAASLGIGDRVEFLGTRLDIAEQLGQMDMFVYGTTVEEGFGIVLAEAMAAGVPIVATDVGPCAEVLDEGRAGLLAPAAQPGALAEAMERLWADADLRARLAAAGRARANTHFSREAAAVRFAALFAETARR